MCLQNLLSAFRKILIVIFCTSLLYGCGDSNTFKEKDSQPATQEQPVSNDFEPDSDSATDGDLSDDDADSTGDDNSDVFFGSGNDNTNNDTDGGDDGFRSWNKSS